MHPGMDRHELLGTFYLLRGAAPEDLAAVDTLVDRRRYAAQEFVFSEDDKPEAMYLLERGTIEILKARDETTIATIGPGDAFGELAFFDEAKRSASARAREASEVARLPYVGLRDLLVERPALALVFYRNACAVMAMRLRQTSSDLSWLNAYVRG